MGEKIAIENTMKKLSADWWAKMRQLVNKGILVRQNCNQCPEFRQPSNYVRPKTGTCIECDIPKGPEIKDWEIQYYSTQQNNHTIED